MESAEKLNLLLPAEKLRGRIIELAGEIDRHYAGREIAGVIVLKGAFVFAADLVRCLTTPIELDFVCLASYGSGTESSWDVRVELDTCRSVVDREVLIVEDVVDTGRSMDFLIEHLYERGAADVKLCALLDKPERRRLDVSPDFVGFVIPNVFVVGFGIDHAQRHRSLPDVYALAEDE